MLQDIVLTDLRGLGDSRVAVAVPTGVGELLVSAYGYRERNLPLTITAGETVDIGRVELDPEATPH